MGKEPPVAADLAPEGFFAVHCGDVRQLEILLSKAYQKPVLTSTITSPPYGNLKDYGHPKQIGWGQPHEEYLVEMRSVFRALYRHTRFDGTLWIVVDTLREPGGPLQPLPFQLADEAKEAGWQLRDILVWRKDKTLPWSSRGRLRNTFEYILLLSKTDEFKYYVDRIRDPIRLEQWWVKWPERYNPQGKVPTNVWDIPIPVQGAWRNSLIQHMCPLPPDLVERLVLLTTDPGDVVLDPFAGTGVVVAEAQRLGRFGVGVELVERYVKDFARVTKPEIMKRSRADALAHTQAQSEWLQDVISRLRVVKYPRVLLQRLRTARPELPVPSLVVAIMEKRSSDGAVAPRLIGARVLWAVDADVAVCDEVRRALKEAAAVPPASKFGIAGEIEVMSSAELAGHLRGRRWFLYANGRTWKRDRALSANEAAKLVGEPVSGKWPLILSNVECDEDPRPLGDDSQGPDDRPSKRRGPDRKASGAEPNLF